MDEQPGLPHSEDENCLSRLLALVATQSVPAEEQYQGKDTFERMYEQLMFEMGEYAEEPNDETSD